MFIYDEVSKAIYMTRGSTGKMLCNFSVTDDGNVQEIDKVEFSIKRNTANDSRELVEKFLEDNNSVLRLNKEDTVDLNPGEYFFQFTVYTTDGDILVKGPYHMAILPSVSE